MKQLLRRKINFSQGFLEMFCLLIMLGRLESKNKSVFVGRNFHCQFQRCPLQMVGTRKQKNHTIELKVSMHLKDIFPVSHFHLSTPYLKVFTVFKLSLQAEDSGSQKCKNVEDILYSQLYFLPAPKAHDHLTVKIYSQYVIVLQCLNSVNNIQNSSSKQDTSLTWKNLKIYGSFPQS